MPDRRTSTSFFANYFLLFASLGIQTPYLQLYLKARGFTPSRIGLLLGIVELAGLAGPILLSRLGDSRSAYRPLLVGSLLASVLAFLPLQLTTDVVAAGACVAFLGFSYRSTIPLLDAVVGRTLHDPARQYGTFRVAGSIGFIVVSLLVQLGAFISSDSSSSILTAFCVSTLLAAGAALFLPRVSALPSGTGSPHGTSARTGFDAAFWTMIAVVFLGRFGMSAYYSFFSLYLRETFGSTSTSGIGSAVSLMWALGAVAEIPPMWLSGRLIARWGIRSVLLLSLLAITARLSLFVLAPSLVVVGLAQLLHAFTFGTFHPAAVAYVNTRIPAERRGMGMAIYTAVGIGLPSFIASLAGGYIVEAHGYVALYLSYAVVPLGGVVLLFTKAGRAGIFDPWKPRPS